jgi:hypothetical protein
MKIHPVGAQLVHGDRQTDRQTETMKLVVPFSNFVKAPKNVSKKAAASIRFQLWRQWVPAKRCYPSTN